MQVDAAREEVADVLGTQIVGGYVRGALLRGNHDAKFHEEQGWRRGMRALLE